MLLKTQKHIDKEINVKSADEVKKITKNHSKNQKRYLEN